MKKIFLLLLSLVLILILAACAEDNGRGDEDTQNTENTTDSAPSENTSEDTSTDTSSNDTQEPEENFEFETIEELLEYLNKKAEIEARSLATTQIPAEYPENFIGLTPEQYKEYVEEGFCNEPMISPANHSVCIIKLKAGVSGEDAAKLILDNCNPRKWVCMSAEYVVVAQSEEYIMLAMSKKDKANALYDEFLKIFPDAVKSEKSAS